ncbi:MAG: GDP-mannose 4,6-dehydratase [candidate division WWE3 bacterium]|nr:GDP-mannose 4,6-dehydratase [candidate division WWE3 bacterium]
MKVFVSGAAGFIGSYVARALVWRGDDVVGFDNFNNYYPKECKEINVDLCNLAAGRKTQFLPIKTIEPIYKQMESFYRNPISKERGYFNFIEGDIVNYDFLEYLFEKEKFDAVVHLAAMAGVPLSTKNPRLYTSVNVDGTINLLNVSKENAVKKFVFGSSSSVYGNREDKKVTEEDNVTNAASPYGATKVAGEVLCHAASVVYGLPIVIDRIFGPIYGPLQRPYGMLMQRAINFTYNNKNVQIYGRKGLDSAKDSTYIDDQVAGILLCLDYATKFDIFNIGTSDPKSIMDWFKAIEVVMNKPVPYDIVEVDKGDVAASADISKAKKILGYTPQATLEEGVRRQVEVFKMMPEWYKTLPNV